MWQMTYVEIIPTNGHKITDYPHMIVNQPYSHGDMDGEYCGEAMRDMACRANGRKHLESINCMIIKK